MTTTATTIQARLGRYQIALLCVNTILLVVGILMVFFGLVLISSYHMTRLSFLSPWLSIFPQTITSLGGITFFLAIMGIMTTGIKNRYLLLVYACLMACLVIPMFFATYAGVRVKEDTDEGAFTKNLYVKLFGDHMKKAFEDDDHEALASWDFIQEDLRCCGDGKVGNVHGYQFWSTPAGNSSVDLRQSCCVKVQGQVSYKCEWQNFFKDVESRLLAARPQNDKIEAAFYRTGCLTVLDSIYQEEILPYMQPVFLLASIIVAVLEIAVVAIAIGYVAVLKRRVEKYGYAGDNGHHDTPF